jgi:hypothetical protein
MVRSIIFFTSMPAYLAVDLLSPTTLISYPCFVYLRYMNTMTTRIRAIIHPKCTPKTLSIWALAVNLAIFGKPEEPGSFQGPSLR